MTYLPNIPQANNLLSQSQADLLTNFNQANLIMGANHVNFNNSLPPVGVLGYLTVVADEGKHTIVNCKALLAATANPIVAANEGAIFTKTVGTRIEAFYKYPGIATSPVMQLSAIKAWGVFTVATLACTGYNLKTPATLTAPLQWRFDFTTALTDALYAPIVITSNKASTPGVTNRTINGFEVGVSVACSNIFIVVLGN